MERENDLGELIMNDVVAMVQKLSLYELDFTAGANIGLLTVNQISAIVEKLGGYEGALKFLSEPEPKWTEKKGVIYFSVTSDGTTGEKWIDRLKKKGVTIGMQATNLLRSSNFLPTNGVVYEIAVLKGCLFICDSHRNNKNIWEEAENRELVIPNVEIACLIREKFSDEELADMGCEWLVAMHEPIQNYSGDPKILGMGPRFSESWLELCSGDPGSMWYSNTGFAFVISQTPAQ